jgi:hypothetical protein
LWFCQTSISVCLYLIISRSSDNLHWNLWLHLECNLRSLLFEGIFDPSKAASPFASFIPFDLHSLLGTCHRGQQDGILGFYKLFGGDILEERMQVQMMHHPIVQICNGKGIDKPSRPVRGSSTSTYPSHRSPYSKCHRVARHKHIRRAMSF